MNRIYDRRDRGTQAPVTVNYPLAGDPLEGFYKAVENGQTRLALEWLSIVVDSFSSRLAILEGTAGPEDMHDDAEIAAEVLNNTPEGAPMEAAKKSPAARRTSKKATEPTPVPDELSGEDS